MVSIISGGSSGLGLEIAKELARNNNDLLIVSRDKNKLLAASESISLAYPAIKVSTFSADISKEQDMKALSAYLYEQDLYIKHVYNVAGSSYFGPFESITRKDIDGVLQSNLIGLMLFTIYMADYMKNHPNGKQRIVSVLSTAALKGKRNETIYNAAKWGARGFLESMRDELSGTSIEIINVYPGGMKTPFWENSKSGYAVDTFMNPEDVAKQIIQISLTESIYTSDITINRPKK